MSKWTKDWPTEEGDYWFYGWRFGDMNRNTGKQDPPEFSHVEVRRNGSGQLMLITRGHFFYKAEGAIGVFLKIDLPTPPAFFKKEFIKKNSLKSLDIAH